MHYSKLTGGFYTFEIHGENIPPDSVEITFERHAELLDGQSQGMQIAADKDGIPILVELPALTIEQIAGQVRVERDRLMATTDWTQAKDVSHEISDKWAPYRRALRDLPQQQGFPTAIEWPEAPI